MRPQLDLRKLHTENIIGLNQPRKQPRRICIKHLWFNSERSVSSNVERILFEAPHRMCALICARIHRSISFARSECVGVSSRVSGGGGAVDPLAGAGARSSGTVFFKRKCACLLWYCTRALDKTTMWKRGACLNGDKFEALNMNNMLQNITLHVPRVECTFKMLHIVNDWYCKLWRKSVKPARIGQRFWTFCVDDATPIQILSFACSGLNASTTPRAPPAGPS